MRHLSSIVFLLLTLAVFASAQFTFTSLDYPGATATLAQGINDSGAVVGGYEAQGLLHALVVRSGEYLPLAGHTILGSNWSRANAINDNGEKVGWYADNDGFAHGFVLHQGSLTTLDYPGASDTVPYGINNSGTVVGYWDLADANGNEIINHGFIWKNGTFTQFDFPGAVDSALLGINAKGDLVGDWDPGVNSGIDHSFVCKEGHCSSFDNPFPGGLQETQANGINANGDVVGIWVDASGSLHGFLLTAQSFTSFDYPGATNTAGWGINASGQIVGRYYDSAGVQHGFLAQPSGCN